MSVTFIGTTFPVTSQWHHDEVDLIDSIKEQINRRYSGENLLINSTWFGPQFDNGQYQMFLDLAKKGNSWQRVFVIAAADPAFLNHDQLMTIKALAQAEEMLLLGHFDTEYQFNFHSMVLQKYFRRYQTQDLVMVSSKNRFINYNRKPRGHRTELVEKFIAQGLDAYGIVTLGNNDPLYSGIESGRSLLLDEKPEDFAKEGNWGFDMKFGIPHDIHSLGNMEIWQNHFVTVVSETEFWPWDNLFVSEKTWKPILGLRPFLINGQSKIYPWLESHGFDTFEDVWPADLRSADEHQVHDRICDCIRWLAGKDADFVEKLYNDLLPRLINNRGRFFEFSKEQKYKTENLF